jgi:transposase-like protein
MAERRKRRRFTAEFKAEAVKRLRVGGGWMAELASFADECGIVR